MRPSAALKRSRSSQGGSTTYAAHLGKASTGPFELQRRRMSNLRKRLPELRLAHGPLVTPRALPPSPPLVAPPLNSVPIVPALSSNEYLMGSEYSVADAHLFVVSN